MLKYKINIKNLNNDGVEKIKCESLFLSPDGTFLSGITSCEYGLMDGQTIFVHEEGTEIYNESTISIEKVTRRGYIVIEQKYKVEKFDNGLSGFTFVDGNTYISDNDTVTLTSPYYYGEEDIELKDNFITIPTKYYVENGKLFINNVHYDVDFEANDEPYISLLISGQTKNITIKECKFPQDIENVIKFVIKKKPNYPIVIDGASPTKQFRYIIFNNTNDITSKLYLDWTENGEWVLKGMVWDENDSCFKPQTINSQFIDFDEDMDYLTYNEITYKIQYEWKNTLCGTHLHLYADSSSLNFVDGQTILAIPCRKNNTKILYLESDGYVMYNGIKYDVQNVEYIKYNDKSYVFHETDEYWGNTRDTSITEINASISSKLENGDTIQKYGYILVNDVPLLMVLVHDKNESIVAYPMNDSINKRYEGYYGRYVEIDNIRYDVLDNDSIIIDDYMPFKLYVEKVMNGNQLRCSINSDIMDNEGYIQALSTHGLYRFELENTLFNYEGLKKFPTHSVGYSLPIYNIYKPINNINIPITLSSYVGINLHQEYVVQEHFFGVEEDKAINRGVDMEKDVYYPVTMNNDVILSEVDEIIFDLHFRTRTLTDWQLMDGSQNRSYNILDYYKWGEGDSNLKAEFSGSCATYQPSDLVGFLGFNNNDVFYQKSKIGKSFLRISFYNGKNPFNSDLLHTATVFMDEGSLYKKYIDNMQNEGTYMSVGEMETEKDRIWSDRISVLYEPLKNHSTIEFDESKRLSSRFIIKNMFEAAESSEGFYLYLFKNFSQGLREQTIYMRIQFNHAGIGKTLNMMQPFTDDGEGHLRMLDLANSSERELLAKGCPLNELYDHLFIEIKVKYDFDKQKYVYYLPSWLVDTQNPSQMHFNLYEVKIADESNVSELKIEENDEENSKENIS